MAAGRTPCDCDKMNAKRSVEFVKLDAVYKDGQTIITLSTSVELRALEFTLDKEISDMSKRAMTESGMSLLYNNKNGSARVGLLNIRGVESIAAGESILMQIPGECKILSAVAVDTENNSLVPKILESDVLLPSEFILYQNYPNPFNLTTQINYNLPNALNVTIDIYNIIGRHITTLVNGRQAAGLHSVTWNAEDVASGVYLYTIKAGEFTDSKKMTLMK